MFFTTNAIGILSARFQHISQYGIISKCSVVHPQCFFCNFKHTNTTNIRRGAFKVLINQFVIKPDGFKDLRSGVGHIS